MTDDERTFLVEHAEALDQIALLAARIGENLTTLRHNVEVGQPATQTTEEIGVVLVDRRAGDSSCPPSGRGRARSRPS